MKKKLLKYYYLDDGRKYNISQVDPEEVNGVMNTKIKVRDNTGKETDWIDTKEFRTNKSSINESFKLRKTIKKKLLETYLKNKK